jgi:hypothetical protein
MGTRPSGSAPILSWLLDAKRDAGDRRLDRLIANAREFQRGQRTPSNDPATSAGCSSVAAKFQCRKSREFSQRAPFLFSNDCLNFNRQFKTPFQRSSGNDQEAAFAIGWIACDRRSGLAMATQWGHAAERADREATATTEMMLLLRAEHELAAQMIEAQLAAERDDHWAQRTAVGATLSVSMPDQDDRRPISVPSRRKS